MKLRFLLLTFIALSAADGGSSRPADDRSKLDGSRGRQVLSEYVCYALEQRIDIYIVQGCSGNKFLEIVWQSQDANAANRANDGLSPLSTRSVIIPERTRWIDVKDLARKQLQRCRAGEPEHIIDAIRDCCREPELRYPLSPFGI